VLSNCLRYVSLTSLNLRGCESLTDQGLVPVVQRCTKLSSLNLKDCPHVGNMTMTGILQRCGWMQNLQIMGRSLQDETIIAMGRSLPQLEFVYLGNIQHIRQETIDKFRGMYPWVRLQADRVL
jgi:F-box/leucine-rich repeat protein 14